MCLKCLYSPEELTAPGAVLIPLLARGMSILSLGKKAG
jgi:hypothetical protein